MSDPPKPTSSSLFAPAATSGSNNNIFSQQSAGHTPTSGSIFGSTEPSPFTSIPATSGSSLFGTAGNASTSGSTLFGVGDKPSSSSFNFGASGSGQTGSGGNRPSGTSAPSMGFAALSTPNKTIESIVPGQTQPTGIFGGPSSAGGGGFFGKSSTFNTSSSQAETFTPNSKPNPELSFFTSTTPAGPPPTASTGIGITSVPAFSSSKAQEQKPNLFGSTLPPQPGSSSGLASNAQPAAGLTNKFGSFGQLGGSGGLFASSKPADSRTPTSTSQNTPSIFGKQAGASQPGGLFGQTNKRKDNESNGSQNTVTSDHRPAGGEPSKNATTNPPSLVPGLGNQPSTSSPTTQGSNVSLFGSTAQNSSVGTSSFNIPALGSSFKSTPSTGTAPNLFGAIGGISVGTSAPPASGSSVGLFSLGTPATSGAGSTLTSATTSATTSQSTLSASAPKVNTFGSLGQPTASSSSAQPTATTATSGTSNTVGTTNINLGTSTTGPPPAAQSRLKNKSMDEIITRWASDLSKYQKEFQKQAKKVSLWDRMLVENSDKIQKLYGSTLEAERATTEVERQLTAVENDQAELAIWLDHYEKEVNQMMSNQVGQGESLQGPDQERQRTYNLVNRLSGRLEEMGKDLAGMITEINDASSNLSKNSKADDPLSQVVRVLNNHLAQLQQIDQGAAALQAKVAAAQKASQSIGPSRGLLGPSSDAADGFYRSYMGRR